MKVFITGTGVISSLGNSTTDLMDGLLAGRSGVKVMEEWKSVEGLFARIAAPALPYDSKVIPRHARRTMSPMSEMALLASQQAIHQAGWNMKSDPSRTLIVMGSTSGSSACFESFYRKVFESGGVQGQLSTNFFKIMNHSVAANVAVGLEYYGALLAPSSACSSSSQAMILAWELIRSGLYDVALVGGADELHYTSAGVFDLVQAASRGHEDDPQSAARPFDRDRDGLVVSEGAGVVVMESEAHANARGAVRLAEFLGGAYLCDGSHMSQPAAEAMVDTMQAALTRSATRADQIDYINAHATATRLGDAQEASAIGKLFGNQTPVSSLKGHLGHTLAACGTIEAIASLEMMRRSTVLPTRNLQNPDPDCGAIRLPTRVEEAPIKTILNNNFAFGGMNTSMVLGLAEQ